MEEVISDRIDDLDEEGGVDISDDGDSVSDDGDDVSDDVDDISDDGMM